MKRIFFLILFLIIPVVIYTLTIRGNLSKFDISSSNNPTLLTGPFESSHERATFAETISLATNHTFNISQKLADFGSPDVGVYKGKFFSLFPPGVSMIILPLYLVGSRYGFVQIFSYATIPIVALLSFILLYEICRKTFNLRIWTSLLVCFIFGFASTSWAYTVTIYQHIPTTFLILLAFYSTWRFHNRKKLEFLWGALAWLAVGLSFFFDYPNALLMIPIIVYFLIGIIKIDRHKSLKLVINFTLILSSLFFILTIMAQIFFSYKVYGKWFQPTNSIHGYNTNVFNNLSQNAQNQALNVSGAKSLFSTFTEDRVIQGLYLLTVAPEKGIFVFSPIFIVAFLALLKLNKITDPAKWVLLAMPIVNLWVYASFVDPWGGWAFGPRYLIPSMPFLAILVGIWVSSSGHSFSKKVLAFVLFLISSAIALMGALTTNLLPPKVEATYLKIPYGLSVNWNALVASQSSSFIYNYFFASQMSLFEYFLIVYSIVVFTVVLLMFIIPIVEKNGN